jgi:hypothetical protein
VLNWVGSDVIGSIEFFVVEFVGIDSFASRDSLFELLNSGNACNDSSNSIRGSRLGILVLDCSLKLLDGNIKHEKSLILLIDAYKKGIEIKVSTIGLKKTLLDLSELDVVR